MDYLESAGGVVQQAWDRLLQFTTDNKGASAVIGVGAVGLLALYMRTRGERSGRVKGYKPTTFELGGGSIRDAEVHKKFEDFSKAYGTGAGEGIIDRNATSDLVNTFYNLVTDFYEWGWGQSFHFSPLLPGKDHWASEAAHETRLAALLKLRPGMKCLDVGCGVGGPMRTISACSGAHVTGITINDYQVQRAQRHNSKAGLERITDVLEADFLKMPFSDNAFDGAYAIEATCHAARLEDVFGEIYRVLKPGSYFASYEWVRTKDFDPHNPEHVRIIDEINFGNGLPEMRTYKEAEAAGKHVGFKLVSSYDIATATPECGPWYGRLKFSHLQIRMNHLIVSTLCALGLAPRGLKDVHNMLVNVAVSLVEGGETGVFSPMHLLLFRKPDDRAAKK